MSFRARLPAPSNRRPLFVGAIVLPIVLISIVWTMVWPSTGWADWMPHWFPVPAEDAYILYRYSENFSSGGGIVWNIGESPVDGATDFLWMVVLTSWTAVFGQVIPGNYILGGLLAVGAGLVAYWGTGRLRANRSRALVLMPVVLVSPMAYHVINGYGVALLSLLLGINLVLFIIVSQPSRRPTRKEYALWGVVLLLVGMARPDANIFNAALLVGHTGILLARRQSLQTFITLLSACYVLPGAIFLGLRVAYFDELLPAPALVKVGSDSLWELFRFNLDKYGPRTLLPIAIFALPTAFLARRELTGAFRAALFAVLIYLFAFQLFSQSQNDSFRFEYPMVYLAALLAVLSFALSDAGAGAQRIKFLVLIAGGSLAFLAMTPPSYAIADAKWPVASVLREYRDDELVLATTEAGVLPFVSGLKTLDTYGLNDYEIARNGISAEYWSSFSPGIIVNHAGFGWPSEESEGNRLELYERMIESGNYVPVAALQVRRPFGRDRAGDYYIVFVRDDYPAFERLVDQLTTMDGETYAEIPDSFSARFRGN